MRAAAATVAVAAGAAEPGDGVTTRGSSASGARWTIRTACGRGSHDALAAIGAPARSAGGAMGGISARAAGRSGAGGAAGMSGAGVTTGAAAGAERGRRSTWKTRRRDPSERSARSDGSTGDGSAGGGGGGSVDIVDVDAAKRLTGGRTVRRLASPGRPSSSVADGSAARRWTMTGARTSAIGSRPEDAAPLAPAGSGAGTLAGAGSLLEATVSAGACVDATGCGSRLSASAGTAISAAACASGAAGGTSCATTRGGVRAIRVGPGVSGCRDRCSGPGSADPEAISDSETGVRSSAAGFAGRRARR
jgi:hypothetical protein